MELADKFEKELEDKMYRAKQECHYPAPRFNQMLKQYGGVETAKRLIRSGMMGSNSSGFIRLAIEERRPELTLEHSVCQEEYRVLFTEEEITYCRQLLRINDK